MTKQLLQRSLAAAVAGGVALLCASPARAVSPLEYPDNGAASFSRGGAWLATANEPIATHYNPAALATQKSAFSVDLNLNYNKMCFDRRNPGNAIAGPNQKAVNAEFNIPTVFYLPACSERSSFPNTIPSLAIAWRATSKLAFGFAVVPPATYGTADRTHGELAQGYNAATRQYVQIAAPWRYMQVRELSTILFPTLSVGFEPFKNFRVGAGFVSGMAVINTRGTAVSNAKGIDVDGAGDHSEDDAISNLRTKDLFVPGIVASLHWSALPQLDVSLWGRYMDSIRTTEGTLISEQQPYTAGGAKRPMCPYDAATCGATSSGVVNVFPGDGPPALKAFKYTIPPEIRAGIRFHLPRTKARVVAGTDGEARDPLHDDVFDIEVNGSYTMNSKASRIEVRFNPNIIVQPTAVYVPEHADRLTGYKDSYGLRLGGQWNAIPDKLGIRAGGWFETQSQEAEYLQINVVGAQRYGFGGGLVFRQDFIDISLGYQRLMSSALDNGGNGKLLAPAATGGQESEDPDINKRSFHAINGGKLTQSAHAFTIGGTIRF